MPRGNRKPCTSRHPYLARSTLAIPTAAACSWNRSRCTSEPQQNRRHKAIWLVRVNYPSRSIQETRGCCNRLHVTGSSWVKKIVYYGKFCASGQTCLNINWTFQPKLYYGFKSGVRKIINRQLPGKQEHQLILFCRLKSELYTISLVTRQMGIPGNLQPICWDGADWQKPRETGWVGFAFFGLETTHSHRRGRFCWISVFQKHVTASESFLPAVLPTTSRAFHRDAFRPAISCYQILPAS